jgi:short-subunit dehydrogenase
VNLWGAIYGVRAFVPLMREQGDECHIVNTASIAGLISPPGLGIYRTTKFAIVGFSEALRHELAEHAPRIKVSVLCPGMVRTEILQSAYRERESHQKNRDEKEEQRLRHVMQDAMPAEQVATLTFDALRRDAFYILTHPERNLQIKLRFEEILGA